IFAGHRCKTDPPPLGLFGEPTAVGTCTSPRSVGYDREKAERIAIETSILIVAVASIAGLAWFLIARRSRPQEQAAGRTPQRRVPASKPARPDVSFTTEAIDAMNARVYELAFGVSRTDYQILGEHAEVLA